MQVADSQTITNLHFGQCTPNDTNIRTFCGRHNAFGAFNRI